MARTLTGNAFWHTLGWQPSAEQERLLGALQEQLRHWNSKHNLTRLVEGDDFWIAQVFDRPLTPLLGTDAAQAPLRLIDVGTGGGFPGLALAIAFPQAELTLVDSVGRKVEAVGAMAAALGLAERVHLRCERIERTGRLQACRGQFDWALARAVARGECGVGVVNSYYLARLLSGDSGAEDKALMQGVKVVVPVCQSGSIERMAALFLRACRTTWAALWQPGHLPETSDSSEGKDLPRQGSRQ